MQASSTTEQLSCHHPSLPWEWITHFQPEIVSFLMPPASRLVVESSNSPPARSGIVQDNFPP
jgi:hypothetical protein